MRALIAAALLLPLTACGTAAPRQAAMPSDPAVAECRAEVRDSPAIRDVWRTQNMNNPYDRDLLAQRMAAAEATGMQDCLRRHGVIRGGGVEQVRAPTLF